VPDEPLIPALLEVSKGHPEVSEDPWRETLGTLLLYAVALLAYALLGMYWHFLLSWTRGFLFAFFTIWLLPALFRRWRP